jgi:hypothetical protein
MIDIRHGGTIGKVVLELFATGLFSEKAAKKALTSPIIYAPFGLLNRKYTPHAAWQDHRKSA